MPEYCWECAVEIEENFEILKVIELRPGKTMEWIEEIVSNNQDRERVTLIWEK